MGLFDSIASAASGWRVSTPGGADARAAMAVPEQAPAAPAQPPAPAPIGDGGQGGSSGSVLSRALPVALRTQAGEIAARQSGAGARGAWLGEIGALFAASDQAPDPGTAYDAFVQAWRTAAAAPQDAAAGRTVVERGDALARSVRTLSAGVERLSDRLGGDIAEGVADLNVALDAIDRENHTIVAQAALKRPTGEAEARRDALVATVVEQTGAQVFPRENRAVALFTTGGQALLDQRPTRFTSAFSTPPPPDDAVDAQGRITEGRLGALLRLASDGSKRTPAQRVDPAMGAEAPRKLRSQLEVLAGTLLGRTRSNQPTSFADAYDSVPPAAGGELVSGVFLGSGRMDLAVNPDLLSGARTLKAGALAPALAALLAPGRQLAGDAVAVAGASAPAFAGMVADAWPRTADVARRDARVAEAASSLMARHTAGAGTIDLQTEVGTLQTLQNAAGTSGRIGHSLDEFLGVLNQVAA